jgi:hypothetical protein
MLAAYIMQYKNGLIGKHFKRLVQTWAFHLSGLASSSQLQLVRAAGELGALLWAHEIDDMNQHKVRHRASHEVYTLMDMQANLDIVVGNCLDAFGDFDPTMILNRQKIHLLTHAAEDTRVFGPLTRSSVEVYECYNAVFRQCCVYGNRQAVSRDCARRFRGFDRIKHLLSGGYYKATDGRWIQAGSGVLRLLREQRVLQRHLGWVPKEPPTPGPSSESCCCRIIDGLLRQHAALPYFGEASRRSMVRIESELGDQ